MRREMGRWRALANAAFALAVLALGGFGLYQVATRRWHVQPTFHVRVKFSTISGLEAGHRVRLQGMDAGVVERVVAPKTPGEPVELVMRLDERLRPLVRADAIARVLAEGMVGARVVEITPGRPDAPLVAEGGAIESEPPVELSDLMKRTGASLQKLDDLARTAKTGLEEINAIAGSIREGKGSLGKFVRDEAAYQSLMSLTHRGERTFSAMEDNLAALKRTWPLSRYSDSRSFFEREKVLYQPGSRRDSRLFRDEELFEPGRAILTPVGRTRLDEVGRWCKQASQPQSEVVIAAFTNDDHVVDLAEVLTQEQADSVRKYLIEKHGIESAGWFRSRKVDAVGLDCLAPEHVHQPGAAGRLRRGDRGRHRERGDQDRHFRGSCRRAPRRGDPGQQYLDDSHLTNGPVMGSSRAVRRHALLSPGPKDGARRGDPGRADRRADSDHACGSVQKAGENSDRGARLPRFPGHSRALPLPEPGARAAAGRCPHGRDRRRGRAVWHANRTDRTL